MGHPPWRLQLLCLLCARWTNFNCDNVHEFLDIVCFITSLWHKGWATMATSEYNHETQDVPTDFNFDKWTASLSLSRKIIQVLRQEELTSKQALSLFRN